MKCVWVCLAVVLGSLLTGCAVPLPAQQVSPAVMEYPDAARSAVTEGHFDLTNESLEPIFATVEAKSFTIDVSGMAHFTPLAPQIHLRLSTASLRLAPKQRRTVYYSVSAASYPAWFCIYSTLSGRPRHNGVNVQLDLPHTVYLLTRARPRADELHFSDLTQTGGRLRGTLHNDSRSFARVISLEVAGDHLKKTDGGFPILPGTERAFEIPVDGDKQATRLRAKLNGFQVEGIVR